MAEYIIATTDTEQLKRELAVNVLSEKVMELTISNSDSTRTVWFLPQESSAESMGKGTAFFGIASAESAEMPDKSPAMIEEEDSLLIFGVDF